MSKHNNFLQNMLAWTKRQRNTNSVFARVFISLLLSLNAYMLKIGGKDVLNECLPLFLCLWCWLWANMYCQICICVKSLVFHASIDVKVYDFYTCQYAFFSHSRENFIFDSRLRALYKKKLLWVKSNLWSSQDNTI